MKPPETNEGLLIDRCDCKPDVNLPDYAGTINVEGKLVPIKGWLIEAEFGYMIRLQVASWEEVIPTAKWYGYTEKQAIEAASQGVEF